MKTMEEAARAVCTTTDGAERFGAITAEGWQCCDVYKIAMHILSNHQTTEATRIMGALISGICIGIEMEKSE